MTTPLELEILLHYYITNSDYRELNAPAIKEAIEKFVKLGLLIDNRNNKNDFCHQQFRSNDEALSIYVETLLNVPLPKMKWTIEKEKPQAPANTNYNLIDF